MGSIFEAQIGKQIRLKFTSHLIPKPAVKYQTPIAFGFLLARFNTNRDKKSASKEMEGAPDSLRPQAEWRLAGCLHHQPFVLSLFPPLNRGQLDTGME